MSVFPGYGGSSYHSPIRADRVEPRGGRQFELHFLNLGYAAGVQSMGKLLRTLRRAESHIVTIEVHGQQRTIFICPLDLDWMKIYLPHLPAHRYFTDEGEPLGRMLLTLAATAY